MCGASREGNAKEEVDGEFGKWEEKVEEEEEEEVSGPREKVGSGRDGKEVEVEVEEEVDGVGGERAMEVAGGESGWGWREASGGRDEPVRGKEVRKAVEDCSEDGGREGTKEGNIGAGTEEEEGEEEGETEETGEETDDEEEEDDEEEVEQETDAAVEERSVSEPSARTVSYFEARSRYCLVLFRGYARFLKALLRALANQLVS